MHLHSPLSVRQAGPVGQQEPEGQQEAADTQCMGQQVTGRVEPEEMTLVVADGAESGVLQALEGVVLQALEGVVLQVLEGVVIWAFVAHDQGHVLQIPQVLVGGLP